jgi:hypothetical protein
MDLTMWAFGPAVGGVFVPEGMGFDAAFIEKLQSQGVVAWPT